MPETAGRWRLQGACVHTAARSDTLTIEAARIVPDDVPVDRVVSLPADWHVLPGFIDAHIHGAMGDDVMDGDPAGLARMAAYLPAEGTTAFLATTMTGPAATIETALTVAGRHEAAPGQAEMLGVHLEGPFVNPEKAGAQPGEHITAPDAAVFDRWQTASGDRIRVVTLAPEMPGGEALIAHLTARGVRASIGHSACTAARAAAAIGAGATRGTHLFNAMNGLHHRTPGVAWALLSDPRAVSEVIADGHHVAPEMIDLAYRLAGPDRLMLITDAMRAKGLGDGTYTLGGQPVTVREDQARLADGTLAGSVLCFDQAFRNLLAFTGCGIAEAIAMTSANAAADLGVADRKGCLAPGHDADIVVLDAALSLQATICRGVIAWQSSAFGACR